MEVSKLAKKLSSEGKEIVNLSLGDTHFKMSDFLKGKIFEGIELGFTHYDKALGLDVLKNNIADAYKVLPSNVVVSNGVKNVLYSFLLTQSNKKVGVLEPAWLGYKGICHLTNTNYIPISYKKNNFLKNLEATEFDHLIICSPNNPDGKVFSVKEIDSMMQIIKRKNATLILDEIYKDFIYEGNHCFEKYYGDKNVITLNGFSKSHAVTGLRVGFGIIHSKSTLDLINRIQQNIFTCSNTVSQYALSFFRENTKVVGEYKSYYEDNRDYVLKELPELYRFKPNGGFYFFFPPSIFGIIENAQEFCKNVLNKIGVALIPGEAYGLGSKEYVRMSFCVDKSELIKGVKKLKTYFREYEKN